jgi:hypothetical protein
MKDQRDEHYWTCVLSVGTEDLRGTEDRERSWSETQKALRPLERPQRFVMIALRLKAHHDPSRGKE